MNTIQMIKDFTYSVNARTSRTLPAGKAFEVSDEVAAEAIAAGCVKMPDEEGGADPAVSTEEGGAPAKLRPSDGMTVPELKAALDGASVLYAPDARKDDLAALFDEHAGAAV